MNLEKTTRDLILFWEKIPSPFKNKYSVTVFIFIFWIIFFDTNNLARIIESSKQVNDLLDQVDYYHDKIREDSAKLVLLKNNSLTIEKFAREQYLMKKGNEEIFYLRKTESD